MKSKIIAAALVGMSFASISSAATYSDEGTVTSIQPNFKEVNQRQQVCEDVEVYNQGNGGSTTGTVIGGVAGGLLGNQVGGGNGRVAATALGAVIGAMTGNNLGGNNNGTSTRQQCHTVNNTVTEQNGYLVTYQYGGHTFTSPVLRNPGSSISLAISVQPR
jgi:uncharacterized protein YcfJ